MRDQLVDLFERPGIEQQVDPLAGGELARLVLPAHAVLAAAQLGAALQVREDLFGSIRVGSPGRHALAFTGLRLLPVLEELLEPDRRSADD